VKTSSFVRKNKRGIVNRQIMKIKWEKKSKGRQEKKKKDTKNRWDKWKKSMMVDLNPSISIITLNVNDLTQHAQ